MRTLRFWLGMPLFNLLILLIFVVFPSLSSEFDWTGGLAMKLAYGASMVLCYGGIFLIPLITGLYYPVERYDCRPLYIPAIACFLGVFAVFSAAAFIYTGCIEGAGFLMGLASLPAALAIAAIETAGYSLGLFIAKKIFEAKIKKA